jgi:xanthine dehydrogenase YagT iron-sulfur-binding subunit
MLMRPKGWRRFEMSDENSKPDGDSRHPNPAEGAAPVVLTRRSFIKGAGALAAAAGLATVPKTKAAEGASDAGVTERLGPDAQTIELRINGTAHQLDIEPRVTLLRALREHLGMTGTKLVCDRGACGACTVHVDGQPINSCMMLAFDARGHEVTTIEGLGSPDRMHPVQAAFVEADAMQCGFCTPGFVMSIAARLAANQNADLGEIRRAVAGNICRCGTYPHVFAAALKAAAQLKGAKGPGAA